MKKYFKNKTSLAIFSSLALIVISLLLPNSKPAQALSIPLILTPFGGQITMVQYCCNGIILTITGPTGINQKDYFMDYASIANPTVNYANYQTFYGGGQPTIGIAFPIALCTDIAAECLDSRSVAGGTIVKIGTGYPGAK